MAISCLQTTFEDINMSVNIWIQRQADMVRNGDNLISLSLWWPADILDRAVLKFIWIILKHKILCAQESMLLVKKMCFRSHSLILKHTHIHMYIAHRKWSASWTPLYLCCSYCYLQCISIAGASLDDAEPLELSSQQSQHGAVDVVQADARRTHGQAGALDFQDGLVQFSLGWAESGRKEGVLEYWVKTCPIRHKHV